MRYPLLIIAFLMMQTAAQAEINCDAAFDPDREATLILELEQFERGLRDLKLPKQTFDRLLKEGKTAMIKNYHFLRMIDEHCKRRYGQSD